MSGNKNNNNSEDLNDKASPEIDSIGDESINAEGPQKASAESESNGIANFSALKEEVTKAKNDYLYLRADFDNYRKSVVKERADLIKYGSEHVFVALLDVLDTLERALSMELTNDNIASFKEGVEMTAYELKRTLENFGLTEVKSLGEAFDPATHEALGSEPNDSVPPGQITQVFKKPYRLHDRVIRHGQVIVAKAPENDK